MRRDRSRGCRAPPRIAARPGRRPRDLAPLPCGSARELPQDPDRGGDAGIVHIEVGDEADAVVREGDGADAARGEALREGGRLGYAHVHDVGVGGGLHGVAGGLERLPELAGPGVILASSTSGIPCSAFTEGLPGRARCLVAHPVNPPHLVPVVELSGAPWTSEDTIARARAIFDAVKQAPITVKKEIEGFILNRLQAALVGEAFRLVQEGYVTPRDLDTTVAEGLGLRWSFLGPFATIELNAPGGIADYCVRYGGLLGRVIADPPSPDVFGPEGAAKIVEAWGETPSPAEVAARSARRDRRLAALAAHKRAMAAKETMK